MTPFHRSDNDHSPVTVAYIADRLGGKKSPTGWVARCPAHDDRTPSLSLAERGTLLYQVVRCEPKRFFQRRPDGYGGWTNKKGERQVLYRLREVLEAPIVFLVEGEKDAETLREYRFVPNTNAGGAKAPWLPEFTEALKNREVILIPDNDPPGRDRVLNIGRALIHKKADITTA